MSSPLQDSEKSENVENFKAVSPSLWEAYQRTEYWIEIPQAGEKKRLCLRVGQSAPGLSLGGVNTPWAYLTAWNPRSLLKPESENHHRELELETRLRKSGRLCFPGVAHDPQGEWPDEKGVLAVGLEKEAARALGLEFGQNAILTGMGEGKVELTPC